MKKVFGLLCISALFTSLVSCADVDSRNNPTDPMADNFEADVLDDSSSSVASGDSDISDENAESSSSAPSGNGTNDGDSSVGSSSSADVNSSSSVTQNSSSSVVPNEGEISSGSEGSSSSVKTEGNSSSSVALESSSSVAPSSSSVAGTALRCGLDNLTDDRVGAVTLEYKTVKMGTQCWLAKNADYPVEGSSCYSEGSCEKYGRLYSGNLASYACPEGSHLPSAAEFNNLISSFGGVNAGNFLKAKGEWTDHNDTNAKGFDALPAGHINDDGEPVSMNVKAYFWSSEVSNFDMTAYYFTSNDEMFQDEWQDAENQNSVRCIVDSGSWK